MTPPFIFALGTICFAYLLTIILVGFQSFARFLMSIICCSEIFFGSLLIAVLFFSDVYLLDGVISAAIISAFDFSFAYLRYLKEEQIKLYYLLCSYLAIGLGVMHVLSFYIRNRKVVSRQDFLTSNIINVYVTSLIAFLTGAFFVLVFLVGGYLFVVHLLLLTRLDWIPGFLLLQIFLTAKLSAFTGAGLFGLLSLLLPYRS